MIKGVRFPPHLPIIDVEREVEEFIEQKLKISVKVKKAREIMNWNGYFD